MAQPIIIQKLLPKFQAPSFIFWPVMVVIYRRTNTCTSFYYTRVRCLYSLFPTLAALLFSVCNRYGERTYIYIYIYTHTVYSYSSHVKRSTSVAPKTYLGCSASRSQGFSRELSLMADIIMNPNLIGPTWTCHSYLRLELSTGRRINMARWNSSITKMEAENSSKTLTVTYTALHPRRPLP